MENDSENSRISIIETIFVILSITFFIRASNNMMMTSVPLLARYDFNFTQEEVGLIAALSSFSTFLTTALLNTRLSSGSRRVAFIASNVVYVFVFVGFFESSYITVWILAAIAGAVLGLMMPNVITAAGLFKDAAVRERVLSLYTVALSLSLVAGPAVEADLLNYYPLRTVFLLFVAFAMVSAILSPLIRFPQENRTRIRTNVFGNFGFRSALLNIMAYNIPFSLLVAFAGIYEKDTFGISLSTVTLLFSFFFMASFGSRLFLSAKPPRNLRLQMVVSMILSISGILMMVLSVNLYMFIAALLILGVPHGLTYPLSVLSITRSFEPRFRNMANSYFFSVMMIIGVVLPFVGGSLIDLYGFRITFVGILFLIVILMILLARNFRAEIKSKADHATLNQNGQ
ncbi:MAG: MFS transporter [Thermoplasmataceae archaeon]|jgi:MFS family permease